MKNFTVGFLPLLVFIIADSFFGLTAGLIIAIVFGLSELGYTWYRERRFDRFILFDTGLILSLGLISLILHNDIFFKLKPGLVELILVVLLAVTAFSNNPLLIRMTGRYMKGVTFSPEQIGMMQRMMRRMFYLFFIHTILIFYSAFYLSKEAWAFISGGLFYIITGGLFLFEFLRARWHGIRQKRQFGAEEWFDVVEPDGKIIGRAPRSQVHGNPQLLHPVVHLHIVNHSGEIFLQKRSLKKDVQPGKWDTAVGGHIQSGETVDRALRREMEEELGISGGEVRPLFRYVHRNNLESELVHGFILQDDGPFYPHPQEISEARFWSVEEIQHSIGKEVFTPNFEKEFGLLMKIVFKTETKGKG
ncbi:MAG: NUDIX domain-containing protein [Calditrichia bacterium]